MRATLDDRAWLQAMLDVEAALAGALADAGVVTSAQAEAVAGACDAARFDVGDLARRAARAGNPVIPLVADLRVLVPAEAAAAVHRGATSQDIVDTSLMLLGARALGPAEAGMSRAIDAAATLAQRHRLDLAPGRTLLQHAVPITFGLTAATWTVGLVDARTTLRGARRRLAVQLGGAAGTLGALDDAGISVVERVAERLGLAAPPLPWATTRGRMAELTLALAIAAGAMGKVATDIIALMQTEVGEVREHGCGGSSAMPHKRNPAGAALVVSAAHQVAGAAGVVLAAQLQAHQRSAGTWHAEWEPVRRALELTAGSAERLADLVEGLEVDPARMRANLDLTGGLVMSEAVAGALVAGGLDPAAAAAAVSRCAAQAVASDKPLAEVLAADPSVAGVLDEDTLAGALDPALHLGSTDAFIDRAVAYARDDLGGATP
ncbi:MAG TPA: lyase family protein [Acidimicrobiales bacterium]|nr:lyase family protein [Acidimicrobiales bacterium]